MEAYVTRRQCGCGLGVAHQLKLPNVGKLRRTCARNDPHCICYIFTNDSDRVRTTSSMTVDSPEPECASKMA